MERAILHCDMNNFYASVECALDPSLKDYPIAVCGNQKERHGIVLAKNYLAKDKGVKTGDAIWQAKSKCPNLVIIDNPHFDKYELYSRLAINIYKEYTDRIEGMGLDECWLDVTNSIKLFGEPKKIADTIRERIKSELGLTISVGVSFNKVFAKLGSDYKKPDATTVINKENFKDIVWPLPVSDMIGIGRKTKLLLNKNLIFTIGDLANEKIERLEYLMGKNGVYIHNAANGLEDEEVKKYYEIDEVKSISHGITTTVDLTSDEEVWTLMLELAQEISYKLRKKSLRALGISVSIRTSDLLWEQYQARFKTSEQSAINLAKHAYNLFKERYSWDKNVRNVTISALHLISENSPEQLNIFDNNEQKEKIEKIEKCVEEINKKYGGTVIKNAILYSLDNVPESRRKINYE